ncbi:hypothetical protein IEQ34_015958 [Dendrobium chrysotoxum]|uniref:Uncharacterized protein n=1 Tax=Dendrobium chrysotoxum TaxID=161865 RepID=A0AAV7GHA8_DENCH|nr:hypothetical protein IEQ34_015958 [Dendrobium chrysotoxum]
MGGIPILSDRQYPLSNCMAPPYTEAMSGDHLPLSDPMVRRNPAALPDGERRPNKGARVDDAASTITGDSLIILHKNFHILNDVVMTVLKKSDRAGLPPLGYLTVYETSLRAGLCFSPPVELVEILKRCRVSLSAISVTVGLIALFRDQGAVLTPEHLSWMGHLTCDIVIEDFKKSIAFKIIIQDHIQEARDDIYEQKTGVEVEGLTPSQASDDSPPDSDGDEIESELQKAFALEVDDEVMDIE